MANEIKPIQSTVLYLEMSELHTENKLSQQCHDNYKHGMVAMALRREQLGEWYNLRKNSLIGK